MSAQKRDSGVVIDDFLGLHTNTDDWKPGETLEQVNCTCVVPGCIRGRDGIKVANFSNDADPVASPIVRVIAFTVPFGTFVVYQIFGGTIKYGTDPQ